MQMLTEHECKTWKMGTVKVFNQRKWVENGGKGIIFKSFKKTYKYLEAISKSFSMLEKFYTLEENRGHFTLKKCAGHLSVGHLHRSWKKCPSNVQIQGVNV